jgi:putative transposase
MLTASGILIRLIGETLRWRRLTFRSTRSIKAENLFLRRQLGLYVERGVKRPRIDPITRISLALLSRFFNWREALVVVRPETMIRWHRAGWKPFWRLKSRPGRPRIPEQIQALIHRVADENPSWGEERIANELLLKLGIQVSPRTVCKYLPRRPLGRPRGDLRWSTFLRLHARGIIACGFLLAVTATFRLLYVFVVIEHRSRRLGAGSGNSRSAAHLSRPIPTQFAPSPRRFVRRRRQVKPWRAASRIFPRAYLRVTDFLRTTGAAWLDRRNRRGQA